MTLYAPPPQHSAPPAEVIETPAPSTPATSALPQSPLSGTREINYESVDNSNSTQINSTEQANVNQQINNSFSHAEGEYLGGGIKLNNPLTVYGQVNTDGHYTRGTVGISWTPGRGRAARRILKLRQAQIAQDLASNDMRAQLTLETHCAQILRSGFSSTSCSNIVVAVNQVAPPPPQPVYVQPPATPHPSQVAPEEGVPALW